VDAVKDPEGPFLCLPKIFDLRTDITTKALAESGWAVVVNEQDENFKIQDLEKKIFTPARNRLMCEAFLKEAQTDPANAIGKSIVFAVNQTHATNLTKIFNELQPGIALTITSRIPEPRCWPKSSATADAPSGSRYPWTCCSPATTAATC
jgi:type I site-specific restriction endonuclease